MKKNIIKKVLITGSSGFIGSNLIKHLLELKNIKKIYCVYYTNKPNIINDNKIVLIKSDLTIEKNLFKIPNDFDVMIHLAGIRDTFLINEQGSNQIKTNLLITKNLLSKTISSECKKIIFLSSVYIYSGNKNKKYNEEINYFPIESLGKSKFFCESLIKDFAEMFKINCICFRAFTVYGNGSSKNQFLTKVVNKINSTENILKFGNGTIKRDFIYVDDVCNAIMISLNKLHNSKKNFIPLNLATGKSVSIKKSIYKVLKLLNKNKKIIFNTNIIKKIGDSDHKADISQLIKYLNWKPSYDLESGLKKMLNKN